jgi:hypothetical protein
MNKINDIFDNLDDWRHLPAYQLERRADISFSITPNADGNRSVKVDYLAKARGHKAVVLIELETDDRSRRSKQDTL